MKTTKTELSKVIEGDDGRPGDSFIRKVAIVCKLSNGSYELSTRIRWGNNQGYMDEHGRHERRYRAKSLQELMETGISETRDDADMNDAELLQAIRSAIFDAEDKDVG